MATTISAAEADAIGPRLMRLAAAKAELSRALSYTIKDFVPPSLVGVLLVLPASIYWERVGKAAVGSGQVFIALCFLVFAMFLLYSRVVRLERKVKALAELVVRGGRCGLTPMERTSSSRLRLLPLAAHVGR